MRFTKPEDVPNLYHYISIGCLMDFNDNKEEVIYKLKAGDICSKCLTHFETHNSDLFTIVFGNKSNAPTSISSKSIIDQLLDLLREAFLGRNRASFIVPNDQEVFISRSIEMSSAKANPLHRKNALFQDEDRLDIKLSINRETPGIRVQVQGLMLKNNQLPLNNWENSIYTLLLEENNANLLTDDLIENCTIEYAKALNHMDDNSLAYRLMQNYFFFKHGSTALQANELTTDYLTKMRLKVRKGDLKRFFEVHLSNIRKNIDAWAIENAGEKYEALVSQINISKKIRGMPAIALVRTGVEKNYSSNL